MLNYYMALLMKRKRNVSSLIKVTGIGPKSALAILASSTPHEVKLAIENENDAYLTQFPGIGKENCKTNCVRFKREGYNY